MSVGSSSPHPPGSQTPDSLFDGALKHVAQATEDLGLRPGDRMFPFYSSLMILCQTLVLSIESSHEAHARTVASSEDKLMASLATLQRHLAIQSEKLQERADEQIRQGKEHLKEMRSQRSEVLNKYSIEHEGQRFFTDFNKLIDKNTRAVGDICLKQVSYFEKMTDDVNGKIRSTIGNLPRNLANEVHSRLGNPEFIASDFAKEFTQQITEAIVAKILTTTVVGIVIVSTIVGVGLAVITSQKSNSASSMTSNCSVMALAACGR
ncbi:MULTISPECIES: hypothetical protein [Methylobacterium]|uniref:Uncharacterized protein n=1 Tax=Methylobacterium persicinum TaxID=374426 RepID=A0ABU0HT04_9HYPH|nr:hypothetical protein [Methylobacterium persicinum]MDQ0445426.1 hypothetical protein [Methylobacterium persicinum]GJE39463.1 hypothetical protein KHHGKMAE_3545 [Methylobacterium persicinum]